MADEITKSPRLSFKGYKFSEAIYRNKDLVKGLLVLITGYSYMTGFEWMAFSTAIAAGIVALGGKLVLDAYDYWVTEVDITK